MKEFFGQLNLLFFFLLLGQVLFCLTVLFINSGPGIDKQVDRMVIYDTIVPIFILSMTFATYLIDRQRTNQGILIVGLNDKMKYYRISVLIRLLLMESANIFAIVIALIESRVYFTIYFLVGLMVFIYFRPSITKFMEDFRLSEADRDIIRESLKKAK